MINFRFVFLITALISFPVIADLDDFAPQPECNSSKTWYKNSFEISTVATGKYIATDEFFFCDESASSVKFWFISYGQNAHICSMFGEAKKADNDFVYDSGECHLAIVRTESVKLLDQGHRCKKAYCGANVYLDGKEFKRQ
jgi:hypothetical protein